MLFRSNQLSKKEEAVADTAKKARTNIHMSAKRESTWNEAFNDVETKVAPAWNDIDKIEFEIIDLLFESPQDAKRTWMNRVLSAATREKKKDDFNLLKYLSITSDRSVTKDDADLFGLLWVGEDFDSEIISDNGKTFKQLTSRDGLRRYRSPAIKYKGKDSKAVTGVQANFEWRSELMKNEEIEYKKNCQKKGVAFDKDNKHFWRGWADEDWEDGHLDII